MALSRGLVNQRGRGQVWPFAKANLEGGHPQAHIAAANGLSISRVGRLIAARVVSAKGKT